MTAAWTRAREPRVAEGDWRWVSTRESMLRSPRRSRQPYACVCGQ